MSLLSVNTECLEWILSCGEQGRILYVVFSFYYQTSKYLAMESNNVDEIEVLDSIMFEVGFTPFIVSNIIYPRPDRGTCTSPGRVSTPQCCQSRRRRPGRGRGQRTAGPADSATPAVTPAAAASGHTSSSSSSSSGASLVRHFVSDI